MLRNSTLFLFFVFYHSIFASAQSQHDALEYNSKDVSVRSAEITEISNEEKATDRRVQAVIDCQNVQDWDDTGNYNTGDQVVREGTLYTARRDNSGARPRDRTTRNWNIEGRCPSPALSCEDIELWDSDIRFTRGTRVVHNDNVYRALMTNRGNKRRPRGRTNNRWFLEGPCEENSPSPTLRPITVSPTPLAPTLPPSINDPGTTVCLNNGGASISPTPQSICTAYAAISAAFDDLMRGQFRRGMVQERSDLFGQVVRYTFHDAGEIDVTNNNDNMRSDGCLSNTAENKGLVEDTSIIVSVTDPIWQQHCDLISRADFYVLLAKLVIEESRSQDSTIELDYNFGRVDTQSCDAGAGRLPNAQQGLDHLEQIFETQMGLTLEDGVTLSGAHTLGHVHPEASGYQSDQPASNVRVNAWDNSPDRFDNRYWNNMIAARWDNDFVEESGNTLNIWNDNGGDIMLNSDMAIAFNIRLTGQGQRCGGRNRNCNGPNAGTSNTFTQADRYRTDEQSFFDDFKDAFKRMTSVGYGTSLTDIDLNSCPV